LERYLESTLQLHCSLEPTRDPDWGLYLFIGVLLRFVYSP